MHMSRIFLYIMVSSGIFWYTTVYVWYMIVYYNMQPTDNYRGDFEDASGPGGYPNAASDKHGRLLVAAAIGISSDSVERAQALVNANVDVLVIDT